MRTSMNVHAQISIHRNRVREVLQKLKDGSTYAEFASLAGTAKLQKNLELNYKFVMLGVAAYDILHGNWDKVAETSYTELVKYLFGFGPEFEIAMGIYHSHLIQGPLLLQNEMDIREYYMQANYFENIGDNAEAERYRRWAHELSVANDNIRQNWDE